MVPLLVPWDRWDPWGRLALGVLLCRLIREFPRDREDQRAR